MNLKLDGWQIKTKEDFMKYLIKETHAKFYDSKVKGTISEKQYWEALDDLRTIAKHF